MTNNILMWMLAWQLKHMLLTRNCLPHFVSYRWESSRDSGESWRSVIPRRDWVDQKGGCIQLNPWRVNCQPCRSKVAAAESQPRTETQLNLGTTWVHVKNMNLYEKVSQKSEISWYSEAIRSAFCRDWMKNVETPWFCWTWKEHVWKHIVLSEKLAGIKG